MEAPRTADMTNPDWQLLKDGTHRCVQDRGAETAWSRIFDTRRLVKLLDRQ